MPGRVYYPATRAILSVTMDDRGANPDDATAFAFPVLPKSCTINRNSYRQPDTFQLTFDANDLPIDPERVQSGAAEIYLYERDNADRQQVISRQFSTTDAASAAKVRDSLASLKAEFDLDDVNARFAAHNRPMIIGQFDDHGMEMSGSGKWVTIRGSDYTGFLAAKQWPPLPNGAPRKIPVGRRLDDTLTRILEEADTTGRLTLTVEGIDASSLPTVGKGEISANRRLGIPVEAQTSYWDVMYKLATRHGFILFVRDLKVVLTRPQGLVIDKDGQTVLRTRNELRHLAWGYNLDSIKLDRHLGRERVPRIVVPFYDPAQRKNGVVEFPDTKLHAKLPPKLKEHPPKKTSTTIKIKGTPKANPHSHRRTPVKTVTQTDEFQVWNAPPGMTDPVLIRYWAENLYYLLGRGERRLVVTTKDMRDLNGLSLLDINVGDAVNVDWMDFDEALIRNENVAAETKYQHLVSRGFGSKVAQVIAEQSTLLIGQKRPMRLKEATFEYDVQQGFSAEIELQDFVDDTQGVKRNQQAGVVRSDGTRIGNPKIDGLR